MASKTIKKTARAARPAPTPPPPEPPRPKTVEERTAYLDERLRNAPASLQDAYRERLEMSWIYHDSALEGTVYTEAELTSALSPQYGTLQIESNMQPICEEIRRHRDALNFIRELAPKKKEPVTVDLIRQLYLILHPKEGDIKTVRYRKDIPQHRLYFHEYAAPEKIPTRVKAVVDSLAEAEAQKAKSGIRIATRAHYDLLRVFPFQHDSGKVARLLLNLLLLRGGYPPAIIHMSERQRYYESLKGSPAAMAQIVQDAINNNLKSVEKLLDAHDSRRYA